MNEQRQQLTNSILSVADWMKAHGIDFPSDLAANISELKLTAAQEREKRSQSELEQYRHKLQILTSDLAAGDITQEQFEEDTESYVEEVLLLLFLLGSGKRNRQLGAMELALLQEQFEIHRQSVSLLASDIMSGRYAENQEALDSRIGLWVIGGLAVLTLAKTFQDDDPLLQWRLGATEEHCSDCARLDGQIHRASEWRASGWLPQNRNLECGGWNCDCSLVNVEGPERGSF